MLNQTTMTKKDTKIKEEKEKKKKLKADKKAMKQEKAQMNELINLDQGLADDSADCEDEETK